MDLNKFLRHQWDRVAAWTAIGVGGLALLLGWLGASDTVYPAEQLPYIISGGILGACLVGVGATLWLSADLRDEWTELHEIARRLDSTRDDAGDDETAAADDAPLDPAARGDGDEAAVAANGRRAASSRRPRSSASTNG